MLMYLYWCILELNHMQTLKLETLKNTMHAYKLKLIN